MLDINTPKGQQTLREERRLIQKFTAETGLFTAETPKHLPANLDGVIYDANGVMTGIYESKCRKMTYEALLGYGSWLVTNQKIQHGRTSSAVFRVPFFGFLYLVPDDTLCVWQITDDAGKYLFDFDVMRWPTRRSVNGGMAYRQNAFLPIEEIKTIYR